MGILLFYFAVKLGCFCGTEVVREVRMSAGAPRNLPQKVRWGNAGLSLSISPCLLMAGTFYAREPVSALYAFVREALRDDWLPFELLGPGGLKLTDENLAFNECGLVSEKELVPSRGVLRLSESPAARNIERGLCLLRPVP